MGGAEKGQGTSSASSALESVSSSEYDLFMTFNCLFAIIMYDVND